MRPFSILMSVYVKDNPRFLQASIKSVVDQLVDIPDGAFEFVLVKDGPLTDDLNNLIDAYCREYPRLFKIITLSVNRGLGNALNEGLAHCSHELIARMDADDICVPGRFRKQLRFLEEHPHITLVGSLIEEFRTEPGDLKRVRKVPFSHEDIISFARKRNPFNHPSVMFRKEAILNAGSYRDMPLFEDYYLWVRIMDAGLLGANLQDVLLYFRTGNDMVGRRHGFKYMQKEYNFVLSMKRLGFINQWQFLKLIVLRLPLRLLPKFLLQGIYQLLR